MREFVLALACGMMLYVAAASGGDFPEPFPTKPIEIIVPFAKGGGLDVAARLLAKYAERELGQNIVVSNKTSGGNISGNLEGIKAEPDGYVIGAWGTGLVTDELIIKNVPYSHKDVAPVCLFSNDPNIVVIESAFATRHGIETLEDLFAHARANPGLVTIGMGGNWTSHDFLRLKMESLAGVKFNRMPFLGGALAAKATAEGNCNVAVPFMAEILPWLESGKIIPLAVAYTDRLELLPDVPTVAEAGYPDMTQGIWRVLTVPAKTPEAVVAHLEQVFRKAFNDPAFKTEAKENGVNAVFMDSRETLEFVQKEYEYYAEKTLDLGIRIR